jgi:hypothetical protein
VAQATDRLCTHAHRNRADGETYHHRDQGLDAPMAVRMVLVGRRRPVPHPEDHGDVGDRIGEAVESIGEHGLTVADDACRRLGRGEYEVAEQTDPPDTTHPR